MAPPPRQRTTSTETDPALVWRAAGRQLLAKTIGEFAYEELIEPRAVPEEDGWYRLKVQAAAPDGDPAAPVAATAGGMYGPAARKPEPEGAVTEYAFRARQGAYGCWFVEPGSVRRAGHQAVDPLVFLADAQGTLGLAGDTAGHLVREFAATLAADVRIASRATATAADLADLGYADLEGHQTGHPWIAFNKGRVGFSVSDTERFAPEGRLPRRTRADGPSALHRGTLPGRAGPLRRRADPARLQPGPLLVAAGAPVAVGRDDPDALRRRAGGRADGLPRRER